MVLYDSGWKSGWGYIIILLDGPTVVGGWRNWLFCWENAGRKRVYRICGLEIERELPYE